MPTGKPRNNRRMKNPSPGKPFKCPTCNKTLAWGNRLHHAISHAKAIKCEVLGCTKKYKNYIKNKREHYEFYHETECITFGWSFEPKMICTEPSCISCNKNVEQGNERYSTNIKSHYNRHKQRALAKIDNSVRVKCMVLHNGRPCSKSFSDKDGLRKHLCGRDGTTTGRPHSPNSVKAAYPKSKEIVARKADPTRTTGRIHRSFTNAEKCRTVKKLKRKRRSDASANIDPHARSRYKKARRDQKSE